MSSDNLIKVYSVADLPDADENTLGLKGSPTQVERIFPPEKDVQQEMLEGTASELTDKLYTIMKEKKFV